MQKPNALHLPVRVNHAGQVIGTNGNWSDAGWSVIAFETIEQRDAFMANAPGAAHMPCWVRFVRGSLELRA